MDATFLAILPSEFQKMVGEVETEIRQEITVRYPSASDPKFIRETGLMFCQCAVNGRDIISEVILPSAGVAPHQLAHEVLHIHRNFVQRVDRLSAKDQDGGIEDRIASGINNELEHTAIVPIEIQAFPNALPYWESDFRKQLAFVEDKPHISALPIHQAVLTRLDMIRSYAAICLIRPEWSGVARYQACLERQGILGDAEHLLEKLTLQQGNKAESISTMVRFAKIDRSSYEICRFDTASRNDLKRPVPAH